jgi:hypothetical protein
METLARKGLKSRQARGGARPRYEGAKRSPINPNLVGRSATITHAEPPTNGDPS